ncbi:SH3 domain-containing protein [Phaeobacter sp. QD34_3]|uniref:SH3 domain-containing protein n=1 Tax=unclassified Phaeobacter TaxID=2621772 RepID=UPI00237F7E97|nr:MULTISPECIES: SH3 domain-containing protein [unclassified Phaeobacter]MDE4132893.1 SH3 domain-containing protein [Phaeobacter sp. QD34_3]MDE4136705.1 SH3 domain-containing protein [Phaeobacter sp. QD34_24]
MSRFVLVSFAFLGWGFYELSGGGDFTPPERPVTEVATAPAPKSSRETQEGITVSAASLVTHTTIETRHKSLVRARIEERQAATVLAPQAQDRGARDVSAAASASLFNAGLGSGGLQLASLEAGLGGGLQSEAPERAAPAQTLPNVPQAQDAEVDLDLRSIRASRVNMRQGPGTAYPIITRLLAGDEVIVIDDNSAGWLHLRTTDNAHFGWIAASLVSKKTP